MPSFFGKTHLYRYDIQGGAKSHYLVFVHLPSLSTHLKHLYSHLSLAADDSLPSTFECLMSSASCPKDCLEYLFQRLQIRDRNVFHCFALSYFNSAQQQSIWLDPDQPMKEQLVKGGEAKASLTLTYLLYPPTPHEIRDENARKILYQQLFCNFLSGIFPISGTLVAHFLRGCLPDEGDPVKIADVLFAAASSSTDFRENLLRTYRDLQSAEPRRVQDQFVELLSERSTYGMIQLEMKTRSNESICLGLNPQGIFSRSFLQTEFQRETYWHQIQSIVSAKQRQISVNCKPTRPLTFAANRSGARLLRLFWEHFRSTSASRIEIAICVPDLRSDGESSSNDCTPSSTRSSSHPSETLWSGSLPNLTKSNATLDDDGETPKKTVSSRRSLPGSQESQGRTTRTFLSSTSIPIEADTISVHDDLSTDLWLADLQRKVAAKIVYDEFDSLPLSRLDASTGDGRAEENVKRNRFADVLPYDDTRVRLIPTKDNLHGYVNASHVKIRIENTIYSYIASQAPLSTTIDDFWRMISGSNVHVIVMLLEKESTQVAHYFPRQSNEKFRTEDFQLELISEQNQGDFLVRQFRMSQISGQRKRTLVHLQYTSWDENQLPLNTRSFIDFINVANSYRRHYGETNPCLVHCTAGIGRTGIFILLHVMIQCITFNKKVNIGSVLKVMREHRMSLIDRTYAYVFVYRCLIDYLKSSRLI